MEKWSETETIVTWIIIALAAVSFLIFSVVKLVYLNFSRQMENQQKENELKLDYQKRLIETSIIVQERERDRIASDLHDSLIGKLTSLRLKNQVGNSPEDSDISLQDCIAEARRISHDLTPPMIEYFEIDELIENVIHSWCSSLHISYYKNVTPVSIKNDYKIQIIRILQEIMVNIHKHSNCSLVEVNLKVSPKRITIAVKDNGKGFDVGVHTKGLGLKNIELRVMYLDGSYKMKSGLSGTSSVFLFNLYN